MIKLLEMKKMPERKRFSRDDSRNRRSRRSSSPHRGGAPSTSRSPRSRSRSSSRSRSRSRSRSYDSHNRRSHSSYDRVRDRGSSRRSRSPPTRETSNTTTVPVPQMPPRELTAAEEDEVAWTAAHAIQTHAKQEVKLYLQSSDYQRFLEHLKRRERERILLEVQTELGREKALLLQSERQKLQAMVDQEMSAERIQVENKLKIEQHHNAQYLQRLREDELRLQQIQQRKLLEKQEEQLRQPPVTVVTASNSQQATQVESGKVAFTLVKKKGLF